MSVYTASNRASQISYNNKNDNNSNKINVEGFDQCAR